MILLFLNNGLNHQFQVPEAQFIIHIMKVTANTFIDLRFKYIAPTTAVPKKKTIKK